MAKQGQDDGQIIKDYIDKAIAEKDKANNKWKSLGFQDKLDVTYKSLGALAFGLACIIMIRKIRGGGNDSSYEGGGVMAE